MANIKSAKKRILINEKNRLRNRQVKSNLKTTQKALIAAVQGGDSEAVEQAVRLAFKKFDMAATKGVIHRNAANRKKAQAAKLAASAGK